jgi:ABC-2 type transport system permease protein
MLTLPIRRETFIFAKLIVLAAWVLGLTLLSVALQALGATVLGLPGFDWAHVRVAAVQSLQIAALVYPTLPLVASLAMLEKGYLPPMMFSAFMATAAFMVGAVGWGGWFPWSMPLAITGSAFGPLISTPTLVPGSFAVEAAVFVVGLAVMLVYIDRADNTQ